MSTVLLMLNTFTAFGYPYSGIIKYLDAKTSGTKSNTTISTATVGSATDVPVTITSGGDRGRWVSGRSPSGGWTLSGQVDVSVYALEFSTAANVKLRIRLHKMAPDGTLTELGGSPWDDNVELSTSFTLMTWSFTPTSMAFAEDDRLVLDFRGTNNGTMGGGNSFDVKYGASTAGSNDSSVTLTETVTFKAEETAVAKPRITHRSQAVARSTVY